MLQEPRSLALVSRYGGDEYGASQDVHLLFHGAGHYDLLVPQPHLAAAGLEQQEQHRQPSARSRL